MQIAESVLGTIALVSVIMILLNITLFFKIWVMTDHINEIKDTLKEWLDLEHPVIDEDDKEK